jgi:hypothetical protein
MFSLGIKKHLLFTGGVFYAGCLTLIKLLNNHPTNCVMKTQNEIWNKL